MATASAAGVSALSVTHEQSRTATLFAAKGLPVQVRFDSEPDVAEIRRLMAMGVSGFETMNPERVVEAAVDSMPSRVASAPAAVAGPIESLRLADAALESESQPAEYVVQVGPSTLSSLERAARAVAGSGATLVVAVSAGPGGATEMVKSVLAVVNRHELKIRLESDDPRVVKAADALAPNLARGLVVRVSEGMSKREILTRTRKSGATLLVVDSATPDSVAELVRAAGALPVIAIADQAGSEIADLLTIQGLYGVRAHRADQVGRARAELREPLTRNDHDVTAVAGRVSPSSAVPCPNCRRYGDSLLPTVI